MMIWKSIKQPPYVWHKDVWERIDGMLFIADCKLLIWMSKNGEKIPFADYIIIGKCA
jgi:hypothetical protein